MSVALLRVLREARIRAAQMKWGHLSPCCCKVGEKTDPEVCYLVWMISWPDKMPSICSIILPFFIFLPLLLHTSPLFFYLCDSHLISGVNRCSKRGRCVWMRTIKPEPPDLSFSQSNFSLIWLLKQWGVAFTYSFEALLNQTHSSTQQADLHCNISCDSRNFVQLEFVNPSLHIFMIQFVLFTNLYRCCFWTYQFKFLEKLISLYGQTIDLVLSHFLWMKVGGGTQTWIPVQVVIQGLLAN